MSPENLDMTAQEAAAIRAVFQGLTPRQAIDAFLPDFRGRADCWYQRKIEALQIRARRLNRPDWAELLAKPAETPEQIRDRYAVLEQLIHAPEPQVDPAHPLTWWLPQRLARACRRQGIETVADLVHQIDALKGSTHKVLLAWLKERNLLPETEADETSSKTLGFPLPPPILDGSQGGNRSRQPPRIDAETDFEAIGIWLSLWPKNSHTFKSYLKETRRLLYWCLHIHGKAFSSLTAKDLISYREFLRQPPPEALGKIIRKPLSPRSVRHAETVLSSLCGWLVRQCYLDSNPFEALPRQRIKNTVQVNRALSRQQWQFVLDYARHLKETESRPERQRNAQRLWFTLQLAYGTGLRLSEMAAATLGDLEWVARDQHNQCWLTVTGKGNKTRRVPFPAPLRLALSEYLAARGHPAQIDALPPETPLIASLRARTGQREDPISIWALHHMLRDFFRDAGAELIRQGRADEGRRLAGASAHWLRHTHGSHAADAGVPLTVLRDNLGHASIQTTSLYLHQAEDERYAEIERLLEN